MIILYIDIGENQMFVQSIQLISYQWDEEDEPEGEDEEGWDEDEEELGFD